jgi:hypothetical protein
MNCEQVEGGNEHKSLVKNLKKGVSLGDGNVNVDGRITLI